MLQKDIILEATDKELVIYYLWITWSYMHVVKTHLNH